MKINCKLITSQTAISSLKNTFNIPLTFLIDDILRTLALNQTNYFWLNKENAKDGRDHYFYFIIEVSKTEDGVRRFKYLKELGINMVK